MNQPAVNWVVALKPEAQPLIERLSLKLNSELSGGGFNVYQNGDATHRLVVSGIGKVNSAAAVAWLGRFGKKWDAWINFGIAGNRSARVGTIFRAGRVYDFATERSWYPPAVWPGKEDRFKITEVTTLDQPTECYPDASQTVEMEAAGFYPTALRFSTAELIQVIKVISDNEETDLAELKPAWVREIVDLAIQEVLSWVPCLEKVATEEFRRLSDPDGLEETINKYHFTETEKHQLKRKTVRALTLGKMANLANWIGTQSFSSGKEILRSMDDLLSDTEGAED